MLAKMDSDGDGTIDKSEFTVWAAAQGARVEELVASLAALKEEMAAKTESSVKEVKDELAALTDEMAGLETKERVDGIEALVGDLDVKAEELEGKIATSGTASAEASEAKVAELSSSTEASLAALKEELSVLSSSMASRQEEMLAKMDSDGDG
eukprot:COSAG05_NODE_12625_length_460_cov_9.094183_1_plen_152_part_11